MYRHYRHKSKANTLGCTTCDQIFRKLNGELKGRHNLLSPGQFIHWMRNKELMLDLIREVV